MKLADFWPQSLLPRPTIIDVALSIVWFLLFQCCYIFSAKDPGSVFFDAEKAYRQSFSAIREFEADRFIQRATNTSATAKNPQIQQSIYSFPESVRNGSRICVGIPTKGREKEQFLARTIASLVDTLSPDQRRSLHVVVLITEDDPKQNPAFGQSWLTNVADEVLLYTPVPDMVKMENYHYIGENKPRSEAGRNEHVQIDYATLMEICQNREADYFLLVEDDIVTTRDWLGQLNKALEDVEAADHNHLDDWIYLRLFYTELYQGWNLEEWPHYLLRLLIIYVFAGLGVWCGVAFRIRSRRTRKGDSSLQRAYVSLVVVRFHVWFSAFSALYFMAGRVSVTRHPPGVRIMDNYGCCAQGLTFPVRHLDMLKKRLRDPPHGAPGDSFIEMVSNEVGLKRWAMEPSVFQHVGIRGSSAQGADTRLEWNFGFER